MTKAKQIEIIKVMMENAYAVADICKDDEIGAARWGSRAVALENAIKILTDAKYAKAMANIYEIEA